MDDGETSGGARRLLSSPSERSGRANSAGGAPANYRSIEEDPASWSSDSEFDHKDGSLPASTGQTANCLCPPGSPSSSSAAKTGSGLNGVWTGCPSVSSTAFDFYWPRRYTVIILQFVGMCITHGQRVNMGVAVISVLDASHGSFSSSETAAAAANNDLADLGWTNPMIGWLHAVFYVGLLITQVPCGYVLAKFQLPSNRYFGGCILLTHSLNFLVPLSIQSKSFAFVCTIRLFQGMIEGMLYPSCYDVMRHWTMPEERSRTGVTVLTGAYIGPTLGTIMSGVLSQYAGWMYIFYFHGMLGIVWFFIWLALVYERPSKHPTISEDECKTMESKQGDAALIYEHGNVPWKAILTSLPVYALVVCNFARSYVFYMMLTTGPAFLHVFHFTHVENGLFLSLPYAFMAVFSLSSGLIADALILKSGTTTTNVRKLFTCTGFGLSAVFFLSLALVNDGIKAVVLMTLAVGLGGIAIAGWQINHLDLAPRYASVLVGITMTFGTLAGVINPIVVSAITRNQQLSEWHTVFWITGLVLAFSVVFYGLFGSGERQPWSSPSPPPVRVITRLEPVQSGKPPYGTFSGQVKYDSDSSSVNCVTEEPPPGYQEAVRRSSSDRTEQDDDVRHHNLGSDADEEILNSDLTHRKPSYTEGSSS